MPDDPGSDAPNDTVIQQGFPLLARDPGAPAPPGYELLAEVGRGGMGIVYRARDLALGRDVAVKVLHDRYPADGPAARQFLEEAQITGQLVHPGVPPVHQVGTLPDGRPFLVMKLIKGHTLDVLIAEGAERDRLLVVFEYLCGAVGYAHDRGVIHRDLKPSNVMVGAFGEVQVMDWGLAKVLRVGDSARDAETADGSGSPVPPSGPHSELRIPRSDDTVAGSVMGTLGYMSPEQAGGELTKIDRRSDVFSLGGVLCAVLTGRAPYTGEDATEVHLKAVRGQTAEAFAALDACGADPELVALAKRCLSADPEERPGDAGALAKAVADFRSATEEQAQRAELARVRADAEHDAIRRSGQQAVPAPAPRLTRRAVLFAVPAAAVAVGGYFAFRNRDGGSPPDDGAGAAPPVVPAIVPPAVPVPVRDVGLKVAAVAVSADARWLAVGLLNEVPPQGGVKLFDRSRGAAPEVWWKWRDAECRGVAFSPAGKLLAATAGGTLRVLNLADEREVRFADATFHAAHSVSFSPDGKFLAVAVEQADNADRTPQPGLVRLWEVADPSKPREFVRLNFPIRCVAFAGDGTVLAAGMGGRPDDWSPAVELWDVSTGGPISAINAPQAVAGPFVAFARNVPLCAISDQEGVKLYHPPNFLPHKHTFSSNGAGEPTAIAIRADGTILAFAVAGVIHLYEVATGVEYTKLEKHPEAISALAFTLDGRTLISGGPDHTVREWVVPAPK